MELTTTFQKIATGSSKSYGQASGYLELWAKYNSQDITNNQSNVTVELRLVVPSGYIGNYQATYWNISGDLAANGNLGSGSYTSQTLGSATGNITHNNDGTKSITFNGSFNPTAWGITLSVTGTATLPTIARASTITSITGGTLGSTISVVISRASSSFTHNVYCKIGSRTQTIGTGVGTSASATLDMNFANSITSGTTQTATMYVDTYNGNTLIGTSTSNFTMTVPSSVVPTISSVTKTDTANYYSTYSAFIQGKSNLRIQTSASGVYSSSISSCTVTLKSGNTVLRTLSGLDVTISGISYTGTITIEVKVTDSRGRVSATNSSTISVLAYSNPNITLFSAERLNNDSTVTLKWTANITALNNQNSKNFKIQYRQKGNQTWNDLLSYNSDYTYSNTSGYTTTKDDNYSWEFRLIAWDNFVSSSNPSSKETEVGTAFELINWGSNGTSIAFGKVASGNNSFECDLTPTFSKNATFTENVSVEKYLIIPKNNSAYGLKNSDNQLLLYNHTNGNLFFYGSSGEIYMAYQNATAINFFDKILNIQSNGLINTNKPTKAYGFGKIRFLPLTSGGTSSLNTSSTQDYFKALLKWICETYPNDTYTTYIGQSSPSVQGTCVIHIYNNANVNSSGMPQYASGWFNSIGTNMYYFGSWSYSWKWEEGAFKSEIPTLPAVTNGSFTVTRSSGNGRITGTPTYAKYGNVVELFFQFNTSGGSVSAGADVIVGTISGVALPKQQETTGVGFYGSAVMTCAIQNDGSFRIRTSASLASNSDAKGMSIKYICA